MLWIILPPEEGIPVQTAQETGSPRFVWKKVNSLPLLLNSLHADYSCQSMVIFQFKHSLYVPN
jgi:hypothetical protein